MHQQCHQEWRLHQSWCKVLLHNPWLWQAIVSGTEVQISLLVSFVGASWIWLNEGGCFVSSKCNGWYASWCIATTSGSVVSEQKIHSIDHDATILDITDLTLEVIQQYVGMNNWENVLAFVSVCKSWKDATDQYRLKIGVELMEGGDGRKLNVSGIFSYLDQEKFWLAEMIYVPCGKADNDVKAKCPRMRLLIPWQWLMMNGNTEFVVEGQSNHPCYCMY